MTSTIVRPPLPLLLYEIMFPDCCEQHVFSAIETRACFGRANPDFYDKCMCTRLVALRHPWLARRQPERRVATNAGAITTNWGNLFKRLNSFSVPMPRSQASELVHCDKGAQTRCHALAACDALPIRYRLRLDRARDNEIDDTVLSQMGTSDCCAG